MPLTIARETDDMVIFRHRPVSAGFRQRYLLAADVHLDNARCNRKMFFRHMDEALECGAPVFFIGDLLDGQQGRDDPRRDADDTDDKYKKTEYVDTLVDETESDLLKYKSIIAYMGLGNHGDAIITHYGSNPIRRLAKRLDAEYFGYAGFARFMFAGRHGHRMSRLLYMHHGAGGGGEVTRGVIKTNRRSVYQPDPDIIATGHIHESWLMPIARIRVSATNEIYQDICFHVQLPTYKREWGGPRGFHMKREAPPKVMGAWWMDFVYDSTQRDNLRVDFIMAQ